MVARGPDYTPMVPTTALYIYPQFNVFRGRSFSNNTTKSGLLGCNSVNFVNISRKGLSIKHRLDLLNLMFKFDNIKDEILNIPVPI